MSLAGWGDRLQVDLTAQELEALRGLVLQKLEQQAPAEQNQQAESGGGGPGSGGVPGVGSPAATLIQDAAESTQ